MASTVATVVMVALLVVSVVSYPAHGAVIEVDVIIVGAGACGLQAGKTLTERGVTNFVIVEATGQVGGRIRNAPFAGLKVELGANWVEGVNGDLLNPLVPLAEEVKLRTFTSFFENATQNIYDENGFVDPSTTKDTVELSDTEFDWVNEFSVNLTNQGYIHLDSTAILWTRAFHSH